MPVMMRHAGRASDAWPGERAGDAADHRADRTRHSRAGDDASSGAAELLLGCCAGGEAERRQAEQKAELRFSH